jgi:hypothetical protein
MMFFLAAILCWIGTFLAGYKAVSIENRLIALKKRVKEIGAGNRHELERVEKMYNRGVFGILAGILIAAGFLSMIQACITTL